MPQAKPSGPGKTGPILINDQCDYCFREFGWKGKAICMNCGLENVRDVPKEKLPKFKKRKR